MYRNTNAMSNETGMATPTTSGLRMSFKNKNKTRKAKPAPTTSDQARLENEART
jgi:hypothetical protein